MTPEHIHAARRTARQAGIWFLRLLAVLYFTAAAVIVGTRWFVTTQLDHYRGDITTTLSQMLGVTIEADAVHASFNVIRPVLELDGVRISRPGGPVSLTLPKVTAEFSWSSLLHLEPRFHLLDLTGAELTVRRLSETRFDVAGFVLDTDALADKTEAKPREPGESVAKQSFTPWLLGQDKLILRDGHFNYVDERGKEPRVVSIENANLVFDQGFTDWRLAAEAHLIERNRSRHLQLRTLVEKTLFSDNADPLTWKGRLWAETDNIDLGRLLRQLGVRSPVRSGSGAVTIWADLERGKLTQFTSDVAIQNVGAQLDRKLEPIHLKTLRGRLSFQADQSDRWDFRAEKVGFVTDRGRRFGPTDITAACRTDEERTPVSCRFGATRIDIGALGSIARSVPLPPDLLAFLKDHPVSGVISDLDVEAKADFATPENWRFNLVFDRLTLPAGGDMLPGFRNLAGTVRSRENGVYALELRSHVASLTFPGVFQQERMNFDELTADAVIRMKPVPTVEIREAYAANRDAAVTARGSWKATGGPGEVDLSGKILRAEAVSVPKYLPEVIGAGVLNYLRGAILGGDSPGGTWELKGELARFPFEGENLGKGSFVIEADVKGGRYDFLPELDHTGRRAAPPGSSWPVLEEVDATLRFEGDGMLITGRGTKSAGLTGTNITVEIPHYHDAQLLIRGDVAGGFAEGLGYLTKSTMLRDIVGDAFRESTGSGPVAAKLDLRIPLAHPEKLRLNLDVALEKNTFAYGHGLPTVTDATGSLRITEHTVETPKPITGRTRGGPLTAAANFRDERLGLSFRGTIVPADVADIIPAAEADPFFAKLTGASPFEAEAVLDLRSDELLVTGRSDLTGIGSALPAPLAKAAAEPWPLDFRFTLPLKSGDGRLRVTLDQRAEADLVFRNDALRRAAVGIGRTVPLPDAGIAVGVKAPKLDVSDWTALFEAGLQAGEEAAKKAAPAKTADTAADAHSGEALRVTNFEVEADEVDVLGRPLHNVIGTIRAVGDDRHLRINSDEARGQVEFFAKRADAPERWSVKLTQLHIPQAVTDRVTASVVQTVSEDVKLDLPDLDVTIDDLRMGAMLIGKVELAARNDKTQPGWAIESLTVRNSGGTLTANGRWSALEDRTRLFARATIRSTGDLLHSLDVRDVIQDAPGTFAVNLDWAGQPQQFSTATLNGHVVAHADKGRLVQVEPGAGRLLSLLSMQHLMRRLTLDFSDVVSKGLVFDRFDIEAGIEGGVLNTPQTTLVSSAASIFINGVVDLNHEALDLKAIVVPSLNTEGASLALAVANPLVGLSTFVAQLALKDQINSFFAQEYHVSGGFDEPVIDKVSNRQHP